MALAAGSAPVDPKDAARRRSAATRRVLRKLMDRIAERVLGHGLYSLGSRLSAEEVLVWDEAYRGFRRLRFTVTEATTIEDLENTKEVRKLHARKHR